MFISFYNFILLEIRNQNETYYNQQTIYPTQDVLEKRVKKNATQVSQYPNKEKGFGINYKNYIYTTKRKEA